MGQVVEKVAPGEGDEHLGRRSVSVEGAGEEAIVGEVAVDASDAGKYGVGEGNEDVQVFVPAKFTAFRCFRNKVESVQQECVQLERGERDD